MLAILPLATTAEARLAGNIASGQAFAHGSAAGNIARREADVTGLSGNIASEGSDHSSRFNEGAENPGVSPGRHSTELNGAGNIASQPPELVASIRARQHRSAARSQAIADKKAKRRSGNIARAHDSRALPVPSLSEGVDLDGKATALPCPCLSAPARPARKESGHVASLDEGIAP